MEWSEVVNSVPESGPQPQHSSPSAPALEAEAPRRHSSAVFNSCYPPNEKVIWKNPRALRKPQKHPGEGQNPT